MATYIEAEGAFSHIITAAEENTSTGLLLQDYDDFADGQPARNQLKEGTFIFHLSHDQIYSSSYTREFVIPLYNGNKLRLYVSCVNGRINLSVNGLQEDDTTWYSSDNVEISGSVTVSAASIDILRAQWWLGGVDIIFNEQYDYESTLGNHNYRMGFGIIPTTQDIGVKYPDGGISYTDTSPITAICPIFYDESSEELFDAVLEFLQGSIWIDIEYDNGDDSATGGEGGSYTSINDSMNFPALPTLSAISTGFIALYAPTSAQMSDIANWLWSSSFTDAVLKNYSDPFNNILGLWISPVVPATLNSELRVGNVASGITANKVSSQYGKKNCGRISVSKYYNSFADYENYRQFKMFLPYYGIVDISTDDFIGGTLEVEYNIDYLTGTSAIHIRSNRNGTPHIINSYTCNLYASVPFSGVNMMQYYQSMVNGIMQIGGGIASSNPMSMANGVIDIVGAKPNYAHSSGMGANSGFLGIQYPYLIECRSIRDMPQQYNYNNGIPLNKTYTLSSLTGYTEVESINVRIPHAADSINKKIEELLKEGVIL